MFNILDVFEMVLDEMDAELQDCWKTGPANWDSAKKAVVKAKKCIFVAPSLFYLTKQLHVCSLIVSRSSVLMNNVESNKK